MFLTQNCDTDLRMIEAISVGWPETEHSIDGISRENGGDDRIELRSAAAEAAGRVSVGDASGIIAPGGTVTETKSDTETPNCFSKVSSSRVVGNPSRR